MAIINILLFQCGDRLQTSDSDVHRRQNLTSKVDPRTERVNVVWATSKTATDQHDCQFALLKKALTYILNGTTQIRYIQF